MDEIIIEFFLCSLKNDFSDFDFDEAFDEYRPYLDRNCTEHGLCDFEDYITMREYEWGDDINDMPDWLVWDNNFISFTKHDAYEAVIKAQWEAAQEAFSDGTHGELKDLLDRIQPDKLEKLKTPQLVELFDECIHAEHCNGFILEDCDPDDLRIDAERQWKDEKEQEKEFPTEIRKFLQV